MASLQACVKVVAARSGTGSQTVTGVVDRLGVAFTGKLFLIYGNSAVNTLQTFFRQSYGFDDLTRRYGEGSEDTNFAGLKLGNTGTAGNYSILDEKSQFFFGGSVERGAYISAVRSGEFDIQYDWNNRTGDSFVVIVLGGDLSALVGRVEGAGSDPTITTTFQPVAALFKGQTLFTSSNATSGGSAMCYGWATSDGNMGASSITVNDGGIATGDNARYQRTTKAIAELAGVTVNDERTALAWTATGFQMSGTNSSSLAYAAVGGCTATCGALTQPAATGLQEITTGLNNRLVILMSFGGVASTSVETDAGTWSFGFIDGTRQASYWCGEDVSFDTDALHGARYLSNADVLRFATPNAGSTTFNSTAESLGFSAANQSFLLNWTTVDGTQRQVLWLALGDDTAAATTTAYAIRRLRRAPHLSAEQMRVFHRRFTLDLEAGLGRTENPISVSSITRVSTTATVTTASAHGYSTGDSITIAGAVETAYNGTFTITVTGATTFTYTVAGSPSTPATGTITATDVTAPVIKLRWSDDGGHTWSSYYDLSAGTLGQYTTRLFRTRLGNARDRIYEVSTIDDAAWRLIGAWLDLDMGTS